MNVFPGTNRPKLDLFQCFRWTEQFYRSFSCWRRCNGKNRRCDSLEHRREEFLLNAGEFFPFSRLPLKWKGGNRKFNLQQEIRGGMREVARRRGFAAGVGETNRKSLHTHVKSSSPQTFGEAAPFENPHSSISIRSGFFKIYSLLINHKLNLPIELVYYELVSSQCGINEELDRGSSAWQKIIAASRYT